MPRISEFFGIVIYMYYNDHQPAHFHVKHGDDKAVYEIETLAVLRGQLSRRANVMVAEWALLHRDELRENWMRARRQAELNDIAPLD